MRRAVLPALALAGALAASAAGPGTAALMQEGVTAYRDGRLEDALLKMGEILGDEPDNATAKNYVWAIARRIQKEEKESRLSPREVARGVALAEKDLEERRRRTEDALARMKDAAQRSGNVRSPADVLAGAAGMERFIGKDLEGELEDAQAQAFADQVAANLQAALDKKIFVSMKDQYRAEGYLAYARQDWNQAAALWEKALKEDPGDAGVSRDLESLRALVRDRDKREKVSELSNQAKLYFRSGRYAESLKAWQDLAKLDGDYPGLVAQTAAARVALEKSKLQDRLKAMTEEGLVLYRNGDVFGAAQKWLEVLQLDPSHEEARAWLQHAGDRMRASGAAPAPKAAPVPVPAPGAPSSAADPQRAMALYKEGMILYAQGNLPEAVRAWEECLRLDPTLGRAREALRQANAELQFK